MNEPTEKQINYAEKIANTLHIELPKEFTKNAYWRFISDHKTQFENTLYNNYTNVFDEGDPWSPECVYDASWFC